MHYIPNNANINARILCVTFTSLSGTHQHDLDIYHFRTALQADVEKERQVMGLLPWGKKKYSPSDEKLYIERCRATLAKDFPTIIGERLGYDGYLELVHYIAADMGLPHFIIDDWVSRLATEWLYRLERWIGYSGEDMAKEYKTLKDNWEGVVYLMPHPTRIRLEYPATLLVSTCELFVFSYIHNYLLSACR